MDRAGGGRGGTCPLLPRLLVPVRMTQRCPCAQFRCSASKKGVKTVRSGSTSWKDAAVPLARPCPSCQAVPCFHFLCFVFHRKGLCQVPAAFPERGVTLLTGVLTSVSPLCPSLPSSKLSSGMGAELGTRAHRAGRPVNVLGVSTYYSLTFFSVPVTLPRRSPLARGWPPGRGRYGHPQTPCPRVEGER